MRFKILLAVSLSFALAESSSEAIQATSGTWAPGYNHPANSITGWPSRFEAINLAVIPLVGTGASSNPGLVIVCSITHHSDMDQRYVELVEATTLPPPNTIIVKTPSWNPTSTSQGAVVAPPGWYMMFLISNVGTPSVAAWVQLQ
jgi:galactose oxidase-like protein